MASRNRGRKKPKLRDYSHLTLSSEEKQAISNLVVSDEQHPIVTAILGYVMVEHELDTILRRRFRNDPETWDSLVAEQGPLRSFAAKITTGYALRSYDAKIQSDLNIIRVIRNAFAHSKKLLKFDDPLLVQELRSAHKMPAEFKKSLRDSPHALEARAAYVVLCMRVQGALLQKQIGYEKAARYRINQKVKKITNPYAGLFSPRPTTNFYETLMGKAGRESPLQLSQLGQSEGPKPEAPQGLLSQILASLGEQKKND